MEPINNRILVPCELAQFALKYRVVTIVNTYLSTKFYTNGSSYSNEDTIEKLADVNKVNRSTIYNHLKYLLEWDWVGINENTGIYFFRSIDTVFRLENWEYKRSAVMVIEDLKTPLEFMVGVVLGSLIKSEKQAKESERIKRRSVSNSLPVSHSFLKSALNIEKRTAQNYRYKAEDEGYVETKENLVKVLNLTPFQFDSLKHNEFEKFPIQKEGSSELYNISLNRLRYIKGDIYVQEPSLVKSNIQLKSRKLRST
jgi:hypothetical protein